MYFNYNFQISPWYSVKWKSPTQMYHMCVHAKSLQSCLTLYDPMDCSLPGSSLLGILQARILEWVAMPFSGGSSPPREQNCVSHGSCIAGTFFIAEPVGKLAIIQMTFFWKHKVSPSLGYSSSPSSEFQPIFQGSVQNPWPLTWWQPHRDQYAYALFVIP